MVLWILPGSSGLRIRGSHSLRPAVPKPFSCPLKSLMQSEPRNARIPVWADPRSLAATYGIDVSFSSSGYLDVSVPRVPSVWLWIHHAVHEVCSCGFPHSDISGSKPMCGSPELFAACRVLRRLPVPRHPPCALLRLTNQCLSTFLFCGSLLFSLELSTVFPVCPPVFPGCLDLLLP